MKPKSPFKFLDSYAKQDKDIFYGREKETKELYRKVFQSKILVVYGASGTGKSSLIHCGLANKFRNADWFPINVRRGENINTSFEAQLKNLLTTQRGSTEGDVRELIKALYLDYFKPIFFIFDQFEELFIFGSKDEWKAFIDTVKDVVDSNLQVRFVFVIRGEYLEFLSEFEKTIPNFFDNRVRIEKMTPRVAKECIEGPLTKRDIEFDRDFSDNLLSKLGPEKTGIELTYLQVYLDRIYSEWKGPPLKFSNKLLDDIGDISDVLKDFLDEQIEQMPDKELALTVLKSFVTGDGTKNQIALDGVMHFAKSLGRELHRDRIEETIQDLVARRILKDKDEAGKYELRHDSIAQKIFQKISGDERDLIRAKQFLDNAYSNYTKQKFLLDEKQLAYIAPFLDKLPQIDEVRDFIDLSEKATRKEKRNKRQLISFIAVIIFLLIVAGILLGSNIKKQGELIEESRIVQEEKFRADSAADVAKIQKKLAEEETKKAKFFQAAATANADSAQKKAKLAEEEAKKAKFFEAAATANANLARKKADLASDEAKEAAKQKKKAQLAAQKADTLSMRSLAQSLAANSISIQDQNQKINLALLAYQFNAQYKGSHYQPDIYHGLLATVKETNKMTLEGYRGSTDPINGTVLNGVDIFIMTNNVRRISLSPFQDDKILDGAIFRSLATNPNNSKVAAGTDNGEIHVYNVHSTEKEVIKVHESPIWAIAFSADEVLFCASEDGRISRISVSGAEKFFQVDGKEKIHSLAVDNRGNVFIGQKQKITKVDAMGSATIIDISSNMIRYLAPYSILAIGTTTGNIELLDASHNSLGTLSGHTASITDIKLSPDGNFLLSTSLDRTARLWEWDAEVRYKHRPIVFLEDSWVMSGTFTSDGHALIGSSNGDLRKYPINMELLARELCGLNPEPLNPTDWEKLVGEERMVTPCEQNNAKN